MNIVEVKIQPDAYLTLRVRQFAIDAKRQDCDYLKIIEGRLVKINPGFARAALGKQCRLVNLETGTFMYRYLYSVIDEYGYWVKQI